MKQLWVLTKVQLGNVFDFSKMFMGKRKSSRSKGYALVIGAVFIILSLAAASFLYSYAIGTTLKLIGMLDLLPELIMALTCVITLITTIYKVKGTLFGFKDYDLIMALPIRNSVVVFSRLVLLYMINIAFTLIIMIPAAIAYGILSGATVYFYAISMLTVFFVPIIPMIAAAIIGTVITVIASGFRHNNLINLILTFGFVIGIMALSFLADDSEEALGQMSAALTRQVDQIYPLARMYRLAVCEFDINSILLFLLISVLTAAVFAYGAGIKFKAINTGIAAARTKADYKIGNLAQSTPFMAIYRKELRRFFSSSLYITNTAVGLIMVIAGAGATLFMSPESLEKVLEIPQMANLIGGLAPLFISVCVTMTYITACSISLEGKNLWILKAAPVRDETIFLSKIAVNLTVTLPAVFISGILFSIGLKLSLAEMVILIVLPVVYSLFTAVAGLLLNLALPNLNWTTEVTVIKQSAASMAAVFGGILVVVPPAALIFVLPEINPIFTNTGTIIVVSVITLFLYRYLITGGSKMFQKL